MLDRMPVSRRAAAPLGRPALARTRARRMIMICNMICNMI